MTDEVFEYHSAVKTIHGDAGSLGTNEKNGIVCAWTGGIDYDSDDDEFEANFTWKLDCTKLIDEGVDRLSGYITLKVNPRTRSFEGLKIDIDSGEDQITVTKKFIAVNLAIRASYEYHLTPHYIEKVSYDEMFAVSDNTDTILVIEEKKVHVNKAFLSFHSEFFRALFSSNFKEGQMTEIPIKDVSYEDFGLLMSTIYPKQVFPNDRTAEKLLELADRFLMPFITRQVEHHLLKNSSMGNEKMMWMADAYGMPELLKKCIRTMDTAEKAKAMQKSEEYKKLSFETRSKLFDRITQFV